MELLEKARNLAVEHGKCSAGFFRKQLNISYATAVQLQDALNAEGLNNSMASDHAFLPPSGASSWSQCSLWPAMNQRFPQPESAEAIEGTAAHWVGWQIYENKPIQPGDPAPNNTIVTDEMIEGGELLVDTIRKRANGWPVSIETKLACSSLHAQIWGTPDCWGIRADKKHIEIFDYKFGHRFVDEFWNPQGLCYLAGILQLLEIPLSPDITVSFTVVQPRCFYRGEPVRTHTFKLTEATPHFNKLAMMANQAMSPNPSATTNDHCGDCPGRHYCDALQLAAYNDAEYSSARTPVELSPVAAALELKLLQRALDRLQARVDGLKEMTVANIKAGARVPFFRVEPGFGRQVWKIPDSQVISIGQLFGYELGKQSVITPKQAEKAGVDPNVIDEYSFKPSTGFRLVAENSTDAPRTFGAIRED